jgi:(p)ppGpp synthase/HD superfamily hydrolase
VLSDRFDQALLFAAELHREQKRKGTDTPYVAHLLAVASLVLENGGDEDEAIAALLHDAIEDQGGDPTRQEIRRRFGDTVTAIVDGCTDSDTTPKPPWRARKEAYLAHLTHSSSPSVRLVSSADKLHNVRSLVVDYRLFGEAIWSRFAGGKEGTLWYYRALLDAFRAAGGTPLLAELERVVQELDQVVQK